MRVFDFKCANGHVHEAFVPNDTLAVLCVECDAKAERQIAMPRFKLEGTTGSFPGAAAKWERTRAEKQRQEERILRDHGEDTKLV